MSGASTPDAGEGGDVDACSAIFVFVSRDWNCSYLFMGKGQGKVAAIIIFMMIALACYFLFQSVMDHGVGEIPPQQH